MRISSDIIGYLHTYKYIHMYDRTLIFVLLSKGDHLRLKFANLKFPKTNNLGSFYYLGKF